MFRRLGRAIILQERTGERKGSRGDYCSYQEEPEQVHLTGPSIFYKYYGLSNMEGPVVTNSIVQTEKSRRFADSKELRSPMIASLRTAVLFD